MSSRTTDPWNVLALAQKGGCLPFGANVCFLSHPQFTTLFEDDNRRRDENSMTRDRT